MMIIALVKDLSRQGFNIEKFVDVPHEVCGVATLVSWCGCKSPRLLILNHLLFEN